MARIDPDALRLELLRTRAAIERAELRAAVLDLQSALAPVRSVIAFVSGRAPEGAARRRGFAAVVLTVVGLLRDRPWLLSALVSVASRRSARRWLVLGAVAAIVAVAVRRVLAQPAPPADGAR